jgi:class 3 adenylate cyclase/tetratricopeptide (TPR) repeat protein
VLACAQCGKQNPDEARFCFACGTPFEAEAIPPNEERKVITVLFCDLVGSTQRAERMDPEDVRALLSRYHERVRSELERHGGTVEKFIGDAVMAIFGAPVAHEDDPERGVRAALAIREAFAEDELQVRIGITTGEALVSLGARPSAGEPMASGDVVNSASRLQAAAPVDGVLVDETTYRATERAIEYLDVDPVVAKGKAAPIPVWWALRARARVGVERLGGAPLVGRKEELNLVRETLARVKRDREPQLVTLVGVPGIGKSRLIFELFQELERGPELVYWRTGRSLPYGEGVTFWALAEMVKAQAGILDSDSPQQAEEKLRTAVTAVMVDGGDQAWIERHLRPLVGLESEEAGADDHRMEAFAAWRRFLEALAEQRPLVLVFEDLHWADEALLDFVDHVVDWASGVPILVLATSRPELLARRPGWGGGKVNSATIQLSPLSEKETATLVHGLFGPGVLSAEMQAQLLDRAGGNPLYAEEFARMVRERPGRVALPESVRGIIAARLDALSREEKELLQNAAVVGKTFWLDALGGDRRTLEERLHALERKEFVRRDRRSSVAGEAEYVFRHALVRDVAYEQIPRLQRAGKHRAAAVWIESLGRREDHAEMLAHHYVAAFEYARAAGQPTDDLGERAGRALSDAGDRAFALNAVDQAARFYERALDLSPEEGREDLLLRYGRALFLCADERHEEILERAAEGLIAARLPERAAEAHVFLMESWWDRGHRDRVFEHLDRAAALVRDAPPSPAKARVLAESSRVLAIAGQASEALPIAEEAYAIADALGLTDLAARSLGNVAVVKSSLGDPTAIADIDRCVELARSVNAPEAVRALSNKGAVLLSMGEVARSGEFFKEGARVADRLGIPALGRHPRGVLGFNRYLAGAWDEAMEYADAFIAECEAGSPSRLEFEPRISRARVRLARGASGQLVLADLARAIEVARAVKDPQAVLLTLSNAAFLNSELGLVDEARQAAVELVGLLRTGTFEPGQLWEVIDATWVAGKLGISSGLRDALAVANPQDPWRQAAEAVVDGDFERAANVFAAMGHTDEAYARLKAAEKSVGSRRRGEADVQLEQALSFYRSVGATRYIREGEALLAATA